MNKTIITAAILALALTGCSQQDNSQKQAGSAKEQERPPMPVQVFEVKQKETTIDKTYSAVIKPYAKVTVPARVGGELVAKHFNEGDIVKKGQLLYTIEQDVYETRVQKAQAATQKARAAFEKAKKDFKRAKSLHGSDSISDQDYDSYVFAYEDAKAALAESQSALRQAKIEYDYTTVTAPITGQAGTKLQDVGSIVGSSGGNTDLVDITAINPVYAHFSLPQQDVLSYLDQIKNNKVQISLKHLPAQKGTIDYIAASIDGNTDTLPLRARFENKQGKILLGEFTKVVIEGLKLEDVNIIPQKALLKTPKGNFVYVVKEGTAQMVPVQTGILTDAGLVVKSGVKPGDKVILTNLAKLRPKSKVQIAGSK
ncbi:MAG: efflux RND transporter periplasmic adaptor subunit [Campylobacterota bacterium]